MKQPGSTSSFGRAAAVCASALILTSLLSPTADAVGQLRLPALAQDISGSRLVQPADVATAGAEAWRQWDLGSEHGVDAQLAEGDGTGTVVAVLDTGYLPHPELAGRWLPGYDFVSSNPSGYIRFPGSEQRLGDIDGDVMSSADYGRAGRDANPQDPGSWFYLDNGTLVPSTWHGTHVAGVIAAARDDGAGISGIAPGVKLLPVRVLGWAGGVYSDIADGIVWASGEHIPGVPDNANPADVINLSLSVEAPCPPQLQRAIDAARANGSIVVAASGNSGAAVETSAPANCAGVVAVAASDAEGNLAAYSNYGDAVDFTAPGGSFSTGLEGGVYSTVSSAASGVGDPAFGSSRPAPGYGYMQGTSMASPHVSAVLALIRSNHPKWAEARVLRQARALARPLASDCAGCGSGIISAAASVHVPVQPVITGLSRSSARAGAAVLVSGRHLDEVSEVEVGGRPARFSLLASGALVVEVPQGASAAGLRVRNGGFAEAVVAFKLLPGRARTALNALPATELSPGQKLVLTGANLGVAREVRLGGVLAKATPLGVNRLEVRVPAGAVDGRLTFRCAVGAIASAQSFNLPPRVLTAELSGRAGEVLTVVGENLGNVDRVRFHGSWVRPTLSSATRVKFVVPRSALSSYARLTGVGGSSTKFWFERVS